MSLREDAVEAMARAFCGEEVDWMIDNPVTALAVGYNDMLLSVSQQTTVPLLDAFLGFLVSRGEDIYVATEGMCRVESGTCSCVSKHHLSNLAAVLRVKP